MNETATTTITTVLQIDSMRHPNPLELISCFWLEISALVAFVFVTLSSSPISSMALNCTQFLDKFTSIHLFSFAPRSGWLCAVLVCENKIQRLCPLSLCVLCIIWSTCTHKNGIKCTNQFHRTWISWHERFLIMSPSQPHQDERFNLYFFLLFISFFIRSFILVYLYFTLSRSRSLSLSISLKWVRH